MIVIILLGRSPIHSNITPLIDSLYICSVSVVGPRILRPFGSYRVAVSGGARPQTLFVAVEGRRATGEQFSQGREVQVQAANSRLIDLDVSNNTIMP